MFPKVKYIQGKWRYVGLVTKTHSLFKDFAIKRLLAVIRHQQSVIEGMHKQGEIEFSIRRGLLDDRRKNRPVFTDVDLQEIKYLDVRLREEYVYSTLPQATLKALISRLEAAEKCVNVLFSMPPINPDDGSNKIINDTLEAWRKAAGK